MANIQNTISFVYIIKSLLSPDIYNWDTDNVLPRTHFAVNESPLRKKVTAKISGQIKNQNAVINIELVRLPPWQWPKVDREAAK